MLLVISVFLCASAFAHEGMIALFTDSTLIDCDDEIKRWEVKDIYLFYLRGYGPDALSGYQFRFLVSSPDVLIMNPTWPPNSMPVGDVTECMQVVGLGSFCDQWGTGDAFYLGTIPVANFGDMDTFTISVVDPIGPLPPDTDTLLILLCEPEFSKYPVIGDKFVFNGHHTPIENPTPPRVVKANANTMTDVAVTYNEAVSAATAEQVSNYTLFQTNNPSSEFPIVNATLMPGGQVASLALNEALAMGTNYTVQVSGIEDLNGYIILPGAPGSELSFVPTEETATLLESFSVSLRELAVELRWHLTEVSDGAEFFVQRAEAPGGDFRELSWAGVIREGLTYTFMDESVEPGTTYLYRVDVSDGNGRRPLFMTERVSVPGMPLTLHQNYPNPFNPVTTVSYYVPSDGPVALDIYGVSGRRVINLVDRYQDHGSYTVDWNGCDEKGIPAASGVYFYRLTSGKETLIRKMILLR